MPSASQLAHAGLPFANPMSEAAVDSALAVLPVPSDPSILDVGCGNGEILVRAARRHRSTRGLGVDLDPDAIAAARRRATGLEVDFEVRGADTVAGRFNTVINVTASHVLGGFPAALDASHDLAPVVLYGDGFWRRSPSEDFLDALGGATADELSGLDSLHAAIHQAGFEVVHESLASDQDWAR